MSTVNQQPAPAAERLTFTDRPPAAVREALIGWLTNHQLDPNLVSIPGWIERDPAHDQVRAETFHLDENGDKHFDEASGQPVTEVTQCAGINVLPFPDVVQTWVAACAAYRANPTVATARAVNAFYGPEPGEMRSPAAAVPLEVAEQFIRRAAANPDGMDTAAAFRAVIEEYDRRAEQIVQLTRQRDKVAGWCGIDLAELEAMDL